MERNFAAVMSELRHARGLSQRKVAADLKISQALPRSARRRQISAYRRRCSRTMKTARASRGWRSCAGRAITTA